jgi:hypothetical protein
MLDVKKSPRVAVSFKFETDTSHMCIYIVYNYHHTKLQRPPLPDLNKMRSNSQTKYAAGQRDADEKVKISTPRLCYEMFAKIALKLCKFSRNERKRVQHACVFCRKFIQ